MFPRIFFILCCALSFSVPSKADALRISLLTCGAGEQIWEIFGHTAIRVTDTAAGIDEVYNYGTFDGYEKGFEWKFMQGKLSYYLSHYSYRAFREEYMAAGRSIAEQELLADSAEKQAIYDFLKWNALRENRFYRYDFLYDNCATRVRDIFPDTWGKAFLFGNALPDTETPLSFRQLINAYFYRNHFERFGVNLLFGAETDKKMSSWDIMFLPDFLQKGLAGATLDQAPAATAPVLLYEGLPLPEAGVNGVFLISIGVALLILGGALYKPLRAAGHFTSRLLLLITGLLGSIMLFMWLGTEHQSCRNNYNLLWALPTNIILAVSPARKKGRYALIAISLLFLSLLLHILKVQELPFFELAPLFLGLLITYTSLYRQNTSR